MGLCASSRVSQETSGGAAVDDHEVHITVVVVVPQSQPPAGPLDDGNRSPPGPNLLELPIADAAKELIRLGEGIGGDAR